jgi:hypothetical protein
MGRLRVRFMIAGLMAPVGFVRVAVAALRAGSEVWAHVLFTAALGFVALAAVDEAYHHIQATEHEKQAQVLSDEIDRFRAERDLWEAERQNLTKLNQGRMDNETKQINLKARADLNVQI